MTQPDINHGEQQTAEAASMIAPLAVEGWTFSQQFDSPIAPNNPDPQATLDAVHQLRARYGSDNVMIGPGYSDDGGQTDHRMSVYLKDGVKPKGYLRRMGASVLGKS